MLSETIAHLTRKIAEELDSLSDRQERSSPQEVAVEDTTPTVPSDLAPESAGEEPSVPVEDSHRSPARPRSLRDVLSWRRFKVN